MEAGRASCRLPDPGLGAPLPDPSVRRISEATFVGPPDDTCPRSLTFLHIKIVFLFPKCKALGSTWSFYAPWAILNRMRRETFPGLPRPVALQPSAAAGRRDRHSRKEAAGRGKRQGGDSLPA